MIYSGKLHYRNRSNHQKNDRHGYEEKVVGVMGGSEAQILTFDNYEDLKKPNHKPNDVILLHQAKIMDWRPSIAGGWIFTVVTKHDEVYDFKVGSENERLVWVRLLRQLASTLLYVSGLEGQSIASNSHSFECRREPNSTISDFYEQSGINKFKKDFTAHLDICQLREVVWKLKEVVEWKELFVHLGMPKHDADSIELDHKGVAGQKLEAISWWLRNILTASWKELADALWKADYKELAKQLYEDHAIESKDSKPEAEDKGFFFKIWRITKDFTDNMARTAFEKIIKKPLNWLFKRKFKARGKGAERQERFWIEVEVKGGEEELKLFDSKQSEIEQWLGCHIEAKS